MVCEQVYRSHNLACHAVELYRTVPKLELAGAGTEAGKFTLSVLPHMRDSGLSLKHNTNVTRCCGFSHLAELQIHIPPQLTVLRKLYPHQWLSPSSLTA